MLYRSLHTLVIFARAYCKMHTYFQCRMYTCAYTLFSIWCFGMYLFLCFPPASSEQDDDGTSDVLTYVSRSPEHNIYTRVPHPLLDPVVQAAQDRLEKFYQQTFWANYKVYRCCQAAQALAKRGENIDRCFIGISPGGVGQSLYSAHLDAIYAHNHCFFDPNVWYQD